jgi:drug/metabolite transporter (DMT)-like permease
MLYTARRSQGVSPLRTMLFTTAALTAFAANSVLCRMALGTGSIDAASFSTVRVLSGATLLLILVRLLPRHRHEGSGGDWFSAAMLFTYMVSFSFAYISLNTGTGALILFGMVQITMLFWALRSGERPHPLEWIGLVLALAGLTYLVLPGLSAPSPAGSLLMALAGISWGVYSLRGRGSTRPLLSNCSNFLRAIPLVLAVSLLAMGKMHLEPWGLLLAVLSGALASGVGYAIWYAALAGLTATRAAVVQLAVPVLAAAGGIVFLAEEPSARLLLAMSLVLGGVGLALAGRAGQSRRAG